MKLLNFILFSLSLGVLQSCGTSQAVSSSTTTQQDAESSAQNIGENYQVWDGTKFVTMELDEKPDYTEGSYKGYYTSLYKQIRYPAEARERGVGGTVWIETIINEFGMLEAARVREGIGSGCDEESLKIVRLISSRGFTPAIKDGKPVKVKFDIPVRFRLE